MVRFHRRIRGLPLLAFTALILAATPSPVGAQVLDSLRATVPFPFVAGGAVYPAGTYTFSPSQNLGFLIISSFTHTGVVGISPAGDPMSPAINAKSGDRLVFSLREGKYVLCQIWEDGTESGEQIAGTWPAKPHNSAMAAPTVIVLALNRN